MDGIWHIWSLFNRANFQKIMLFRFSRSINVSWSYELTQPAFQRWFTGESTSGTMVESTLDYVSILQIGSTLILWRCFTAKSWRCFTVEIVTLFHRLTFSMGELRSFCRRWINVELCVDFANWINVDNTTLFHRRTFNMNEYTTVRSIRT